jgi:hypothetical protein
MMERMHNHTTSICIALKVFPLRRRDGPSLTRILWIVPEERCVFVDHALWDFVLAAATSRRLVDTPVGGRRIELRDCACRRQEMSEQTERQQGRTRRQSQRQRQTGVNRLID